MLTPFSPEPSKYRIVEFLKEALAVAPGVLLAPDVNPQKSICAPWVVMLTLPDDYYFVARVDQNPLHGFILDSGGEVQRSFDCYGEAIFEGSVEEVGVVFKELLQYSRFRVLKKLNDHGSNETMANLRHDHIEELAHLACEVTPHNFSVATKMLHDWHRRLLEIGDRDVRTDLHACLLAGVAWIDHYTLYGREPIVSSEENRFREVWKYTLQHVNISGVADLLIDLGLEVQRMEKERYALEFHL